MAKLRAHEVSRDLGIETKDLMEYAERLGISIKNHMSGIEDDDIVRIKALLDKKKQTAMVEKRVGGGVVIRRRRMVNEAEEAPREALPDNEEFEESRTRRTAVHAHEDSDVQEESRSEAPFESEETESERYEETVSQDDVRSADYEEQSVSEEEIVEETSSEVEEELTASDSAFEPETSAGQAEESAAAESVASGDAAQDEAKATRPRKRLYKPKQIATIVKQIDLAEIMVDRTARTRQAPRPQQMPRPQQQQQPSFEPDVPVMPEEKHERPSGKTLKDINILDESGAGGKGGKRRPRVKTSGAYEELDEGRRGGGHRWRQVIDESYLRRRGKKGGKKGKDLRDLLKKNELTTPKASKRVVKMAADMIQVSELAHRMGVKATDVVKKLMSMGMMVAATQSIDLDTATLVANEFSYEIENVKFEEKTFLQEDDAKVIDPEEVPRPAVVTVMGHVDHGKTSLLDRIRNTRVAEGESGGITQHIGAYSVPLESGSSITFVDTPGHEAFTAMRARGAKITDIVILMVAADDGMMPQTIEALNHSRAAGVPVIVAINKIDKPDANLPKVYSQLLEHSLVPESLGGETIVCEVSAKTGRGIPELLEMINIQAGVMELKANPKREQAQGIVVESKLDKGHGPVATILVQQGTLEAGNAYLCGTQAGRIKAMISDKGVRVKEAGPSTPVEIWGFSEVPNAGDIFYTLKDEKQARLIADNRKREKQAEDMSHQSVATLETFMQRMEEGAMKSLSFIVKSDVHGTVEALRESLDKLCDDNVKISIIHSGVGGITEGDVLLALASNAIVLGFRVRPEAKAARLAKDKKIQIKLYDIIYELLEDIEKAKLGLFEPVKKEEITGHLEVRSTFFVSKVGTIAGCYVQDGKIDRQSKIRVLRDNTVVYESRVGSLKRFKDDAKEVTYGYECGVGVENFNDIKVGDILEVYKIVEVAWDGTNA